MFRFAWLNFLLLLLTEVPLAAQTAVDTPVQQLRAKLAADRVTVAVAGLHAATKVLVRPIDNRVIDGAVQTRAIAGMFRGADDRLLQPGELVRVMTVDAASDSKNDILRLTVVSGSGAQAPVAFVLPRGALASMTEAQLEATVAPVLAFARQLPSGEDTTRAAQAAAPVTPPPVLAEWQVHKEATGQNASVPVVAEAAGKRIPAMLTFTCTAQQITTSSGVNLDAGTLVLQLRVARVNLQALVNETGDKDGDDNGFVHLKLGSAPELVTNLSRYSVAHENGGPVALVPELRTGELRQIVHASGTTLQFDLESGDVQTTVHAKADLPRDAGPLEAVVDSCLEQADARDAALKAQHPVACPDRAGLVLVDGTVRYALSKKELPIDPDRDQCTGWNLPKATRAHPVPPKLILSCGYAAPASPGAAANAGMQVYKAMETLVLEIPPSLAGGGCETWIRTAPSRSVSFCVKPGSTAFGPY